MKKLSYLFLILAGLTFVVISCSDDDDGPAPNPGAPTISVSPNATDALPGEDVTFTINATAGTGATITSVTADDGSGAQNVSGNSYTYTVDPTTPASTITITFTVTDDQPQMASTTAVINVGKPTVDISDDDIADGTYNWTADNVYLLDGLVFLMPGGVLNIEAGTIIKFKAQPTGQDVTSALIITRGAQIFADGTADDPIIFTAEADDLTGNTLTPEDNGQWGGLLILGQATAEKGGANEIQIEGIDSSEPRGLYGSNTPDDNDNSGSLTYVSIRYTGIGFQPGDELQGLTLGGVGNGTTISHIDIFSSADDGIEIFGGTVDIRYVSVAFSTDDDFDFDLGYRGTGQYLFSIMRTDEDGWDHAGEWDGASPDDGFNSMPDIYNVTFIGPGTSAPLNKDKALLIRENFAGNLGNSIFLDFPDKILEVQDLAGGVPDSYDKLDNELFIKNNTWSNFNGSTDLPSAIKISDGAEDATGQKLLDHLATYNNKLVAEQVINGISREQDGGLDPRPTEADTEVDAEVPHGIDAVGYRGAFDPAEAGTWLDGWSSLSKFGYLAN